ncbi:MAG: GNAT family protein, partial [Nitrospirales bacterium]
PIQQVTSLKFGPIGGHTLKSEALCLRPKDCDDLAAAPNAEPYPGGGAEGRKSKRVVCFSVHLQAHDEAIGFCAFDAWENVERAAELRLRLVDECGDLRVTETAHLMLKFGFDELELRKVYTQLRKVGQSDMVWWEKIGFRQERGTREAFHPGAEDHEIAVMGLLRKDYRG